MASYVYDPETGQMVPGKASRRWTNTHIIPDIQPYQVVGPEYGKVITSRSRHREYLKSHGLIEIGDQKPSWLKK